MGNVEIDKRITCEVLFYDRRKIKKLKRKKFHIIEYGEYSVSHSYPNFPYLTDEILKFTIYEYPDNGCLIIPVSKKKIKIPIRIIYDDKKYIVNLNTIRRHLNYKKYNRIITFFTFFMFDNKSELMKWKLKHG